MEALSDSVVVSTMLSRFSDTTLLIVAVSVFWVVPQPVKHSAVVMHKPEIIRFFDFIKQSPFRYVMHSITSVGI